MESPLMIPSNIIEEIREKADIVNIISEYVKLKKRGKNHIGLCPFHSEKTPSFTVSQEKNLFHCFGCSEGGNIFAFVMKMENLSFAEAVRFLGEKVGVSVPDAGGPKGQNKWGNLYDAIKLASHYYQQVLADDEEAGSAKEYLKNRGINDETARSFKLGFAKDSWDSLSKHLIQRGVHPKDMEQAGLCVAKEGGGSYDRFRGRIIFPICDDRGRERGFGARILGDGEPKYLNSPETPIYQKSRILYGMDLAKEAVRKKNQAIVVEGYMDVITCHRSGIKNVVASMGTALTEEQAKLLSRFCENVVLAYDTDLAGNAATERGVEILKRGGFHVKISEISSGKDPDEMIRSMGESAFIRAMEDSIPWLQYKINSTIKKHNLKEIESRARAIREAAAHISKEPERLVREEYIKYSASLLKTTMETIAAEVKRETYYTGRKKSASQAMITEKPRPKIITAEESILKLAIENKEIRKILTENLHWGEFTEGATREIAELLASTGAEKDNVLTFMLENLPSEQARKKLSALMIKEHPVADERQAALDYIATIKAHHLRAKTDSLRGELEEAEKKNEDERVKILHREFLEYTNLLRSIERTI